MLEQDAAAGIREFENRVPERIPRGAVGSAWPPRVALIRGARRPHVGVWVVDRGRRSSLAQEAMILSQNILAL